MWFSKRAPHAFFNPEVRATMVALLIQASKHLSVYLQVGQWVPQISQGHVLSSVKLILCSISHTLCFFMLGPITRSPFKNCYSAAKSLMFLSSYSPFFVICISARHLRALSTILSIGNKMESGSENTIT
jgi:hypothetical protein